MIVIADTGPINYLILIGEIEARLDAGERDAILLAEELGADQIIIDEARGRWSGGAFFLPGPWTWLRPAWGFRRS